MRGALSAAAALVSLGGVLCLAACAAILGIGDRQLEQEDAATDGGPTVIAKDVNLPMRLLVDSQGKNLYWSAAGDLGTNGGVYTYDIASGATKASQAGLAGPTDMAMDSDSEFLYWIDSSSGQIAKCDIASGCPSITTLEKNAPNAVSITVDSSSIYWLTSNDGTLHKADKTNGGNVTSIATPSATGLVAPDSCFFDSISGDLFISDPGNATKPSSVWKISTTGTGLTKVQGAAGCQCRFTNSSSHVYWTSYGNGSVMGVDPTSSAPPTTILTEQNGPYRVTYDVSSNELYLANFGTGVPNNPDGTVVKFSLDGTSMSNLAANLDPAIDVAVAGSFVYFLTWGQVASDSDATITFKPKTGTVVRVAK
jgi:hypothetical protein